MQTPSTEMDLEFTSPTKKRVTRDPDSQLDQIIQAGNRTSSPSTKKNDTPVITPPKPKVSYEHRTNAGTTILTYNPNNLPAMEHGEDDNRSMNRMCKITQPYPHVDSTYKHMTDAMRHTHLDQRLVSMTERMIEAYNIPILQEDDGDDDEEMNDNVKKEEGTEPNSESKPFAPYEIVGVPRQSLQTNIGRICNDAHDGKLNKTTLLLEGSRHGANGTRIELDVEKLVQKEGVSFSLFQGQIVLVEGYNHSGRRMVAERLVEGLPFQMEDMEMTSKSVLRDMHYGEEKGSQNGKPVKVMTAAGPYTTSQDLEYQPLMDLLGTIEIEKPDVVILMGPFVDLRQEKVESGEDLTVEYEDGTKRYVTFEQFFAAKVSSELEALYESDPGMKTQFVLVPSMDDAIAEPV
jgi:DNA polymerase alpha subunit B